MALTVTRNSLQDGWLTITVTNLHPDEPGGHCVMIPVEAIANRKAQYGLNTNRQAVLAILKEHYARLRQGTALDPNLDTATVTLDGPTILAGIP